jgi:hypothetical protein
MHMVRRPTGQATIFENPVTFTSARLDPENRWVKIAGLVPWDTVEEKYTAGFENPEVGKADIARPLSGSVEIDETYFRESFKGNHKKFKLPRSPHTRGDKSHTRGLSGELVCVAFGVDNAKNIVSAPIGNGMPSKTELASFYGSHIETGSIVHSDSLRGYGKMLRELSVKHIAVKAGSWKNGVDHLHNVNNIHSDCKRRLNRMYNGVSTKFLIRYLYWFKWVHDHTEKRMEAQSKDLFLCGSYTLSGAKMKDFNTMARRLVTV